jgi:hypothetical protein
VVEARGLDEFGEAAQERQRAACGEDEGHQIGERKPLGQRESAHGRARRQHPEAEDDFRQAADDEAEAAEGARQQVIDAEQDGIRTFGIRMALPAADRKDQADAADEQRQDGDSRQQRGPQEMPG